MAIPYCPGYDHEPFVTLVANYPGKDVHPPVSLFVFFIFLLVKSRVR
jgi:hypothetical protein